MTPQVWIARCRPLPSDLLIGRLCPRIETRQLALDILAQADAERVVITGHSFGGASTVMCSRDPRIQRHVRGAVIFDVWPMPVPDVEKGLFACDEREDDFQAPPSLSILSEQFAYNNEVYLTRRLCNNRSVMLHFDDTKRNKVNTRDTFSLACTVPGGVPTCTSMDRCTKTFQIRCSGTLNSLSRKSE